MRRQRKGGFLIGQIHRLARRILSKKLREHNVPINPAQGRIMFVLWRKDGIPITQLASQTGLGKTTLTSMLDRLEKQGYLRRKPSKRDRREILLWRTERDKSYQDSYVKVSQEMTQLCYAGFRKKEIDQFEGYLGRVLANLVSFEERPGRDSNANAERLAS